MAIITKLEAAHRQLTTAIRMFFADDDIASIHTLACAAREIYEKHCKSRGIERMFEHIHAEHPGKTEKELWDILNGARNFLKHPNPDHDLDASIELDDEGNAAVLFIACHDCGQLCGDEQPNEVQAFNLWFVATRFPPAVDMTACSGDESTLARAQRALEKKWPNLRNASVTDQKRVGRELLVT